DLARALHYVRLPRPRSVATTSTPRALHRLDVERRCASDDLAWRPCGGRRRPECRDPSTPGASPPPRRRTAVGRRCSPLAAGRPPTARVSRPLYAASLSTASTSNGGVPPMISLGGRSAAADGQSVATTSTPRAFPPPRRRTAVCLR